MDFELSLSHPELENSSGHGLSIPILASDLPYSVWMEHPDGSTNFVSFIQPLRFSDTRPSTTPPSATGWPTNNSPAGTPSDEAPSSDPYACLRATPISRPDVLSLIGFLICRLLIGTRLTRLMNIADRPIRSLARLNREIYSSVSLAPLTEEPQPGGPGDLTSGQNF
jgi:hypothetical protein